MYQDSSNNFIHDAEREHARKVIQSFLGKPAHSGGILVVTGPRGVGKTRLVDESLNQRETGILDPIRTLFGDPLRSRRLALMRSPRSAKRLIVPVPVSPFLPQKFEKQGINSEDLELGLLRNLLFALTNTIDPRLSIRRYGKTLRSRLGFWSYWFSPTGLSIPGRGAVFSNLTLFVPVMLILALIFIAVDCPWAYCAVHSNVFSVLWICLLSIVIVTVAWVLLRYLDWKGVKRYSARLYDLIHAKEMQQRHHQENRREMNLMTKWNLITLIVGTLVGAGATAILLMPEKLLDLVELPAGKILLAALTSALFSLVVVSVHKRVTDTAFGLENAAWQVILLRRYLYLLHRCGIEPVLIVDELDKLEENPSWVIEVERENKDVQARTEMDDFLTALVRLKDSLGTEFLWVLISGPGLLLRFRRDLAKLPPGPLSTLIHEKLVLGPVSWRTVVHSMTHEYGFSPSAAQSAWLRGKGHYASILALQKAQSHQSPIIATRVDFLTRTLDELWESEDWPDYLALPSEHAWTVSQWQRTWIHEGMLELAKQLVYLERTNPTHADIIDSLQQIVYPDNYTALLANSLDALIQIGSLILYQRLIIVYGPPYATGGEKHCGIAPIKETKNERISLFECTGSDG